MAPDLTIEELQRELRRKLDQVNKPTLGGERGADTALRQATLKERLEDRRARLISELAEVEGAIRIITEHPEFETFYDVVNSKRIY